MGNVLLAERTKQTCRWPSSAMVGNAASNEVGGVGKCELPEKDTPWPTSMQTDYRAILKEASRFR